VDWKVKTGEFKVCQRCGLIISGKTGPNTKYCSECKEIVRKKRVKERVKKHRENGRKEDKEAVRKRVEKYRNRWGWQNKNEQLGSGRLSPKMSDNFKKEEKLIKWELRRLGVKSYD
jgi:ribosome-binding protein aMBF1 (putative translation factor)